MNMYPAEETVVIDGEEVSYPGLVDGKFSSGDFSDPTKRPSFIPAETINLILDNLAELIAAVGGEPTNIGTSQLVAAITSAATAKRIVQRDAAGRARVADPAVSADIATKGYVDAQILIKTPPIGFVYFQGAHDIAPGALFSGTTWTDVSSEEANLARRVVGSIAGPWIAGTPANLSISVAGGTPSISIVSGGTGYLSGGTGTIPLFIVGSCTTQMMATASVVNGAIASINTTQVGAGYTAGSVAVYDGIFGHPDLVQRHVHNMGLGSHADGGLGSATRFLLDGAINTSIQAGDGTAGTVRSGVETTCAYLGVKKWRRTA